MYNIFSTCRDNSDLFNLKFFQLQTCFFLKLGNKIYFLIETLRFTSLNSNTYNIKYTLVLFDNFDF